MAYSLPEIGLDLSSPRRTLAVRDRSNGAMVPLAVLNTVLHKWEIDKNVAVPVSTLAVEVLRSLNPLALYGFVGDGASHPISGVVYFKGTDTTGYTLAQWQSLVPQITALTNEIDGVAIQAAITTGMATIPDGARALASFGFATSGGETVIRGDNVRITWTSDVAVGITHGTPGSPATGRLYFTGKAALYKGTNLGVGSAISAQYASGAAADYSGSFGKLLLRNWGASALKITNFPRGMTLDEVIVWGPDYSFVNGDAITITGNLTSGTFGLQAYNCMSVNYRWTFGIDVNAAGGGEGYIIESCRGYAGSGFLRVKNSVYNPSQNQYYQPPLFRVVNCDWEGYGLALSIDGVADCIVEGGYWVLDPRGSNAELDRPGILDLKNTRNFKWRGGEINILPGVNGVAADGLTGSTFPIIFRTNSYCKNVTFERPSITCNSTAFYLACEINTYGANVIREFGATFDPAFSGNLFFDPGNNQVCEARVRALGGRVDVDTGEVTYVGSTAGTTNGSGVLASSMPTGLFRTINSTRSMVWNNDGDVAPNAQATLRPSTLTTTAFSAVWSQAGAALANANVRQSFIIRGT